MGSVEQGNLTVFRLVVKKKKYIQTKIKCFANMLHRVLQTCVISRVGKKCSKKKKHKM